MCTEAVDANPADSLGQLHRSLPPQPSERAPLHISSRSDAREWAQGDFAGLCPGTGERGPRTEQTAASIIVTNPAHSPQMYSSMDEVELATPKLDRDSTAEAAEMDVHDCEAALDVSVTAENVDGSADARDEAGIRVILIDRRPANRLRDASWKERLRYKQEEQEEEQVQGHTADDGVKTGGGGVGSTRNSPRTHRVREEDACSREAKRNDFAPGSGSLAGGGARREKGIHAEGEKARVNPGLDLSDAGLSSWNLTGAAIPALNLVPPDGAKRFLASATASVMNVTNGAVAMAVTGGAAAPSPGGRGVSGVMAQVLRGDVARVFKGMAATDPPHLLKEEESWASYRQAKSSHEGGGGSSSGGGGGGGGGRVGGAYVEAGDGAVCDATQGVGGGAIVDGGDGGGMGMPCRQGQVVGCVTGGGLVASAGLAEGMVDEGMWGALDVFRYSCTVRQHALAQSPVLRKIVVKAGNKVVRGAAATNSGHGHGEGRVGEAGGVCGGETQAIEISIRDPNTCVEALALVLQCLDSCAHSLAHERDAAAALQECLTGVWLCDAHADKQR